MNTKKSYRKCENCGSIRRSRKTYHCVHCGKLVCLDCYNWKAMICVPCEVMAYNVEYKSIIDSYAEKEKVTS